MQRRCVTSETPYEGCCDSWIRKLSVPRSPGHSLCLAPSPSPPLWCKTGPHPIPQLFSGCLLDFEGGVPLPYRSFLRGAPESCSPTLNQKETGTCSPLSQLWEAQLSVSSEGCHACPLALPHLSRIVFMDVLLCNPRDLRDVWCF